MAGVLSDRFRRQVPRPLAFGAALLLMGASQVLLTSSSLLLAGFMAMGAAYGALWALIPSLTAELFGEKQVAQNYAVLTRCVSSLRPPTSPYAACRCLHGEPARPPGRAASWSLMRALPDTLQ